MLEALISLPVPAPPTRAEAAEAAEAVVQRENVQGDSAPVVGGADNAKVVAKEFESGAEKKDAETLRWEKEKEARWMSLLKPSYEYILRLRRERLRKDERIARLENEFGNYGGNVELR